jgi:CheY-like chemotaxis protein
MVFLIDDDTDDLEIVKVALEEHSYKGPVNTATDGERLFKLMGNNYEYRPDVIVLDLNMPLMDGFQALRQIKENAVLCHIPVIVLTASSSKEDERRCFELGCDFFLRKPTKIDDYIPLVSIIKRFVSRTH